MKILHIAPHRPLFNSYASAAVSVYEHGGSHALLDWITHLQKERNIYMYILDKQGNDLLGRTIPPEIQEAILARNSLKESLPLLLLALRAIKKKTV